MTDLEISKTQEGSPKEMGRLLAVAETSFKAALDDISKHVQYFRDITEHGIEEAHQMAYIVEAENDDVQSSSYRTAREALTSKLEIEATKKLGKTNLEIENNNNKKGGAQGVADSE